MSSYYASHRDQHQRDNNRDSIFGFGRSCFIWWAIYHTSVYLYTEFQPSLSMDNIELWLSECSMPTIETWWWWLTLILRGVGVVSLIGLGIGAAKSIVTPAVRAIIHAVKALVYAVQTLFCAVIIWCVVWGVWWLVLGLTGEDTAGDELQS